MTSFQLKSILFLHSILFFLSSFSQHIISGKILDKKTREPIPFANIIVKNSSYGTVSDIDGNFTLTVPQLPVSLQVSYIGFETCSIEVLHQTKQLQITLTPTTIQLPEIIIKPTENPALRIIRKVIEMRNRNNPEQLNSFQYIAYNKLYFTIDRKNIIFTIDTIRTKKNIHRNYPIFTDSIYHSIRQKNYTSAYVDSFFNQSYLFLSESVSKRYFQYPDQNKEIILSTRTSGLQQPYFVLLATQFQSFSFYNDFVTILDKKYLNPLSPLAIGRYFYEISDTILTQHNDTIFVIQFRPLKHTLFDGLSGTVHIHTRHYAIQAIKAEPAAIQPLFYVRIQQLYSFIDSIQWFPVQLNTDIKYKTLLLTDKNDTLRINDTSFVVISKSIPLVGIGKSYIDSITINTHIPKKTFNNVTIELLKHAHKTNDTVWTKYRKESFGKIETNTYKIIDSIGKEIKLDKKIQSLEYLLSGYIPYKFIHLGIYNLFDFNRFEGFRINADLLTNDQISSYFSIGGFLGYAFRDKQTKFGIRANMKPNLYNDFQFNLASIFDTRETGSFQFFDDKSVLNNESFRRIYINRMDYRMQYNANVIFRTFQYLKSIIQFSTNTLYLSEQNWFSYNNNIHTHLQYQELWFGSKFLYKEKFFQTLKGRYSLGSSYPSVFLNLHFGQLKTYKQYYFKSECKIKIPIHWGIAGKSQITFLAGYTPSNLPLPLVYNGKGTKFLNFMIYSENTFATMQVNEFFYHSFAYNFIQHDFGHILFKIGKFKPGLILHHNIAIGNLRQNIYFNANTTHKPYTECGIQCYSLFRQSFNSFGIAIFYRYGYYKLNTLSDNLAFKISISYSL
ncbi:MAG: DUF5686 and carboxypeptidase regulatory-like domain-containing protein [Bacteroidales bacterium]|nr:DUF5686 and carboxypeptidase regulatory-like domain-containing protein [Bacteroidales bacterium]